MNRVSLACVVTLLLTVSLSSNSAEPPADAGELPAPWKQVDLGLAALQRKLVERLPRGETIHRQRGCFGERGTERLVHHRVGRQHDAVGRTGTA